MTLVVDFLIIALLASVIIVHKASHFLDYKELKRRAREWQDSRAAAIYKAVTYGSSFSLLLWLIGSVCAAYLLIIAVDFSAWLAVVVVLFLAWALLGWQPARSTRAWEWAYAAALAPAFSGILSLLQPILGRAEDLTSKLGQMYVHTGVYEKEDLLDFINRQLNQPENRIPEEDLKMVAAALTFGDKTVSHVMTPLREVRMVNRDETVGPMLMDELHKTGFSRFPVTEGNAKAATPEIIGTLYLKDIIGYEGSAKVKDMMDKGAHFINETQSLREALDGFLKTRHHLFIVTNNFEEMVGVVSLEDVLEQAMGTKMMDEFDQHDDLRAVAAHDAEADKKSHHSA
jgi:CBS domain containing-hemolysin-like protein